MGIVLGLTEFECPSFVDFLTWKENEEEMTTTYYVQCTGKRAFSDNGNEEEKGKLYVYVPKFILYPANYRVQILLFLLSRWKGTSKYMDQA